MHIRVLGAAAGGGLPQWNANGPYNERARAGDRTCPAQTQSSIAVSADGEQWVLFNASPDIRQQLNQTPALWPQAGQRRHTPIRAVILTNADVDHIAGLLTLRERQGYSLYGSSRVLDVLAGNSVFNVLNPDFVARRPTTLNVPFEPVDEAGKGIGLLVRLFPVPGKVALFLEDESSENFGTTEGDTVGVEIMDPATNKTAYYIPGCAAMPQELANRLNGAPLVMFDGTLFSDDEMVKGKESPKTGARMGHMSISGPDGTMAAFELIDVQRKVLIHINNTNPVLAHDSDERAIVERAGWEVAFDGMEIAL